MKVMRYRTKVDVNGNILQLVVNNVAQRYAMGYGLFWSSSDDIITTKKEIHKIADSLKEQGYERADNGI